MAVDLAVVPPCVMLRYSGLLGRLGGNMCRVTFAGCVWPGLDLAPQ
jgi:hypothetical protein